MSHLPDFCFKAFSNFAGIKTSAGTLPSVTSSCIVWVSAPRCMGPPKPLMGQVKSGRVMDLVDREKQELETRCLGRDPIFSTKTNPKIVQ